MAAGAAANLEQVLAPIQHFCPLQHSIAVVALIAPRLEVFLVIKRPQPVLVSPVTLLNRSGASPVSAVARRATEAIRIVDLQQVAVRMGDERSLAVHVFLRDVDRFANSQMTGLAAVDHNAADVDLLDVEFKAASFLFELGDLLLS